MAKYRQRMQRFKTSPPSAAKIRRNEQLVNELEKAGFEITSIQKHFKIGRNYFYSAELTKQGKPPVSLWISGANLAPHVQGIVENYRIDKLAMQLDRSRPNQTFPEEPSCSNNKPLSADNELYLDLKSKGYSMQNVVAVRGITSATQYKTRLARDGDSEMVEVWLSRRMFETDLERLLIYEFRGTVPRNEPPQAPPQPVAISSVEDTNVILVRDKRFRSGYRLAPSQKKFENKIPAAKGYEKISCDIGVQVDLMASQTCENCDKRRTKVQESTAQTSLTYFVFDSVYCLK